MATKGEIQKTLANLQDKLKRQKAIVADTESTISSFEELFKTAKN